MAHGQQPAGIGLAFNNFDPTNAVLEPDSALLLAIGIATTVVASLRRR